MGVKKDNQREEIKMLRSRKILYPTVLFLFLLSFLFGCSSSDGLGVPSVVSKPSDADVSNESQPTECVDVAVTKTPTPTILPTIVPTFTPTLTITPTPLPTINLDKGPVIVVVSPDEDPEKLREFLEEAIVRGYTISNLDNFKLFERPLIIVLDNLKSSGVTNNQKELVDCMGDYGKGVLAVVVDTMGGSGADYMYNLSTNEGWSICVQGSRTYTDLSLEDTWVMSQALGWFQGAGEDNVYKTGIPEGFQGGPTPGYYPSCVIPLGGNYSQALIDYLVDVFNPWLIQHPEVASGGAIDVVVSLDDRRTFEHYLEVYPSIRELSFEDFPY